MFYVYAIKSKRSGRLYIGQTQDVEERLKRHNKGYVRSTAKDRFWDVCAIEAFKTREEARWRERELKKSRGKRIKWLKEHRV